MTRLATGLHFPEGPVALSDGSLLCVEVLAGYLAHVGPDGKVRRIADVGGGPNGTALGPDGACYVCNNGGLTSDDLARLAAGDDGDVEPLPQGSIQRVDLKSGTFELLYGADAGSPLLSPNDLVFDALGGFYFSDYGSVNRASPQAGAIYYAAADGSRLARIDGAFVRPNGVGLSPAGDRLYVAETASGRLWSLAIAVPGDPGTIGSPELLYEDASLSMDSLAVQADGKICVACPHNDLIVRVASDGAAERIATPPGSPANLAFGGPGMRTAFVTFLRSGEVHALAWDAPGLQLHFNPYADGAVPGARS